MNSESLHKLFDQVRKKQLSPDEAVERLRHLPFEDLGFAKVDHHRALRHGTPEVIFAKGKTPSQVAEIFDRLAAHGGNVLATRATEEQFAAVLTLTAAEQAKQKLRGGKPGARYKAAYKPEYRPLARAITLQRDRKLYGKGVIAVVSAGTSDIPVAEEAVITAELMGNRVQHIYDVGVAGIHRLLATSRRTLEGTRDHRLRRNGRRVAQRSRWPRRSPGNSRPNQHRLRRGIRGPRRVARNDELLRLERERGQHR